jgi:hypothetical protein
VAALFLFNVWSFSRLLLCCTISAITASSSCCCWCRSDIIVGSWPRFYNSFVRCILLYWWNSNCAPSTSFHSRNLSIAVVKATSAIIYVFHAMTSSGIIASLWSSIKESNLSRALLTSPISACSSGNI